MTNPVRTSTLPLETASIVIPGGELTIVVDPDDGAVIASGFTSLTNLIALLPADEQSRGQRHVTDSPAMALVLAACRAYSGGDTGALDSVAVRQSGGPFIERARQELRGIPAGETDSYAGLAARAGRPAAVRAAGQACATNKVAPFVPCHRILRTDGTLGGYAYGLPVKLELLIHEGVVLGS